jgi:hypothetical protein
MKKRTKKVFQPVLTPPRIDFAYLERASDPEVALSVECLSQKKTKRSIMRNIRKAVQSGQHPALSRYLQ